MRAVGACALAFVAVAPLCAACGGEEPQSDPAISASKTTTSSFPRGIGRETRAFFVLADQRGRFPKVGRRLIGTARIREEEEGLSVGLSMYEGVRDGIYGHVHEGICEEYDSTKPVLARLEPLVFGQSDTTIDLTFDALIGDRLIDLHHPKRPHETIACGYIVPP
jgi:hypothetical protein